MIIQHRDKLIRHQETNTIRIEIQALEEQTITTTLQPTSRLGNPPILREPAGGTTMPPNQVPASGPAGRT
jgi:hypothetical protein